MRRLHHLTVVLALILSLLVPSMACALPNVQMTPQEHACCQKMKGNCDSMRLPASHPCCQQNMQANHLDAVQPESVSVSAAVATAILPSPAIFDLRLLNFERASLLQHSPPISPPPTISILRI